ncbi:MAG: hypothetical protein HYT20_00645 [Candidatus Nealsonbacteria bacterium]|nr:hypothetical protein [Candidatus Nealsonbacteria bacterium]
MYNWAVDENKIKKHKRKYAIWKLEQMVNFGLNGEKINGRDLKKLWEKLKIDPARKRFLEILLHEK